MALRPGFGLRQTSTTTTTTTTTASASASINLATAASPSLLSNVDSARHAGFLGRTILPPLPPQGPSAPGRSSSPRYHVSSSTSRPSRNNASSSFSSRPSTPTRRRRLPAFNWGVQAAALNPIDVPDQWDDDIITADDLNFIPSTAAVFTPAITDDQFLAALAENDFSSPSSYPSFTNPLSQAPNLLRPLRFQASSTASDAPAAAGPRPQQLPLPLSLSSSRCSLGQSQSQSQSQSQDRHTLASPSRSATQLTNSNSADSQISALFTQDILDDFLNDDFFSESPDTSFSDAMPPTARSRTSRASPAGHDALVANKRRRTTPAAELRPPSRHSDHHLTTILDSDDDLFGESPSRPGTGLGSKHEEYATIDLTEATEVPEELKKPEVDKRIKIATFQCVICMDDATTLTVTHCGHMYCAQCLHSSLIVEATKGKCPMCRTKIDMKPRSSYSAKTKGYWPLELKLMTATRKGKRKADVLS